MWLKMKDNVPLKTPALLRELYGMLQADRYFQAGFGSSARHRVGASKVRFTDAHL